jgi:hypothetical protein
MTKRNFDSEWKRVSSEFDGGWMDGSKRAGEGRLKRSDKAIVLSLITEYGYSLSGSTDWAR